MKKFVVSILPDWHWEESTKLVEKDSEQEIAALFNKEYVELQKDSLKTAETCNILMEGIDYAQNHGTCHNKTENELFDYSIVATYAKDAVVPEGFRRNIHSGAYLGGA